MLVPAMSFHVLVLLFTVAGAWSQKPYTGLPRRRHAIQGGFGGSSGLEMSLSVVCPHL